MGRNVTYLKKVKRRNSHLKRRKARLNEERKEKQKQAKR